MTIFNFYRVGYQWALKIIDPEGNIISTSLFSMEVTDDEITKMAISLAKADNITTNVNFKEE